MERPTPPTIGKVTSNRRTGVVAAVLVMAGVVLLVGPPLARDGVCGLVSCADQVPDIAVTRTSASGLAVLVPQPAAPSVRSVQLLEGGGRGTGSRRWFIQRDGSGNPSSFPVGSRPAGFRTVTELTAAPSTGTWTAQVGFRCTTASLPFAPDTLAVGEVRSWSGVISGPTFSTTPRTRERCQGGAGSVERTLLVVGGVVTVVGALLGILVVLRAPVRFPEEVGDDVTGFDEPRSGPSAD